jgi:streptomycin 6-kinase
MCDVIVVPERLGWWRETPAGAAWLDRLPAIVAEAAERWELTVGDPFDGGHVSLVAPAARSDGTAAVLKVNFPDAETEHEADALERWDGVGAARLLDRADDLGALLVERLEPGTRLWTVDDEDEANTTAAEVLRMLRREAEADAPFRALADEAARWAVEIPELWLHLGRPFGKRLVEELAAACRDLVHDEPLRVLLHQDFHGGNVLRSGDGWRAIDPKPLVGDPAFDAASLLRDRSWLLHDSRSQSRLRRRLDLLSEVLELDRERMRLWAVVHALAWGLDDDGVDLELVECARLLSTAR